MRKNKTYFFILLLLVPLLVFAAATTLNNNGNWSDTAIWSGGDVGDNINDVVDWNSNIGTVVIQSGEDYTIGNMDMNNGNTLTINSGGNLDIGDGSNPFSLTTGNTATINVDGTLEIWGDLNVSNTLILNVTGSVIVHGDVNMGNGASIDVSGGMTVDGDLNGGTNTDVNVDGNLDVGGIIDVDNGSDLTGGGSVSTGGGCTGPPEFCSGTPLPVELIFFIGRVNGSMVELKWATAIEENVDYFAIERSIDGVDFKEITQVNSKGYSYSQVNYSYVDRFPIIGNSYYRLKTIDFDGYTEIFDYVFVKTDYEKYHASVYPVPVTEEILNIQLNFDVGDNAFLVVYDNKGHTKLSYDIDSWQTVVNLSSLEPGSYLVKIITDKSTFVKRILVK